jgi:hypothetical protein
MYYVPGGSLVHLVDRDVTAKDLHVIGMVKTIIDGCRRLGRADGTGLILCMTSSLTGPGMVIRNRPEDRPELAMLTWGMPTP